MKTCLDCIPCFVRQALDAARMHSNDEKLHEKIVRDVLSWTSEMDLDLPTPAMAQRIQRRLRQLLNVDDPYAEIKSRQNALALALLPALRKKLDASADAFSTAARLAIAGNIIDLGVTASVSDEDVHASIEQALKVPLVGDLLSFRKEIFAAERILYLMDNAGEIVFDMLFIEHLPKERITAALRGGPTINDATMVCAHKVGLPALVNVIDNGSDAPGTILNDCSHKFLEHWKNADLIISKGQGNFESLFGEVDNKIFFLFKAKCDVVAKSAGVPKGSCVLRANREHN